MWIGRASFSLLGELAGVRSCLSSLFYCVFRTDRKSPLVDDSQDGGEEQVRVDQRRVERVRRVQRDGAAYGAGR